MLRPLVLLLLIPGPAIAQEVDCANAMAQVELNACAHDDWQAADAELNNAYKAAMAAMRAMDAAQPPELQGAADALRSAQRAWITFRDANCASAGYPMRGGSAEPLLIYGCLGRMTRERTAELLELAAY